MKNLYHLLFLKNYESLNSLRALFFIYNTWAKSTWSLPVLVGSLFGPIRTLYPERYIAASTLDSEANLMWQKFFLDSRKVEISPQRSKTSLIMPSVMFSGRPEFQKYARIEINWKKVFDYSKITHHQRRRCGIREVFLSWWVVVRWDLVGKVCSFYSVWLLWYFGWQDWQFCRRSTD